MRCDGAGASEAVEEWFSDVFGDVEAADPPDGACSGAVLSVGECVPSGSAAGPDEDWPA